MLINEIELAFSNACTARCTICSPIHGEGKPVFMNQQTFDRCIDQMSTVEFNIVQTGGDGDSFLNPIFIDSLRTIRKKFPKVKISLFSNFLLLFPAVADILIKEQLIDTLGTRIDSLNPVVFSLATGGLNFKICMQNIAYFTKNNNSVDFSINYSDILSYKDICKANLNTTPFQWDPLFDSMAKDEFSDICTWVRHLPKKRDVPVNFIKRTLWAERHNPRAEVSKTTCQRTHLFDEVCYIWTDGAIGICGYDDYQKDLIYGNIHNDALIDIWTSQNKKDLKESIVSGSYNRYPCNNPKCCIFY